MTDWEYASYWIWDRNNTGRSGFNNLRALGQRGWQVVGEFVSVPELSENAGLWVLRRPKGSVRQA